MQVYANITSTKFLDPLSVACVLQYSEFSEVGVTYEGAVGNLPLISRQLATWPITDWFV